MIIEGVQRSTMEQWSSELWSEIESVQSKKMTVCQLVFVTYCNQLYKGPMISIIKSKTRLLIHANPRYVTIIIIIFALLEIKI
jgi:hypothetical protein